MKRTLIVSGVATLAFASAVLVAADKTVWDGVYTEAQAARGKVAYNKGCSSCHLPELQGGFGTTYSGTPLKGQRFVQTWEDDLIGLSAYVRSPPPGSAFGGLEQKHGDSDTPRGAKDQLSDADKLDVLAYILQVNGFPTGNAELTVATIPSIRLQEKDPQPIPNFALARSVGCLVQAPDKTWLLTTSDLRRARSADPSKPSELKTADTKPLGNLTIQLMDIYPDPDTVITPEQHVGHKVQAKGIFMKDPTGDRINVNVLEMVGATCAK